MSAPEGVVVVAVFLDGRFYVAQAFPSNDPELCEFWLSQFSDDSAFTFLSRCLPFFELSD